VPYLRAILGSVCILYLKRVLDFSSLEAAIRSKGESVLYFYGQSVVAVGTGIFALHRIEFVFF
jgi:hypothetical protein